MPQSSANMPQGNKVGSLSPRKGKNSLTYSSGQNSYKSGLCIATNLNGTNCMKPHRSKYIPYCADCCKSGDPSLGVGPHPRFGKFLFAKRDLPAGYRSALFGPAFHESKMNEAAKEWGFETFDNFFINPTGSDGKGNWNSQVQYSQCPGPNERVTLTFASPHLYMDPNRGKTDFMKGADRFASMMFVTPRDIKKNYQLCMMYAENEKEANEFFKDRGIERCDVYVPKFPTELKAKASVATLKLFPGSNCGGKYVDGYNKWTDKVSKQVKKPNDKKAKK